MIFEFATAGRIIFGPGMLKQIGPLAAGFGRRALVIVNSTVERAQPLIDLLNAAGVGAGVFQVQGEPTVQRVLSGVQVARSGNCDLIIGLGGGSAMDSAKAIAALLTNPGDPLDYLEVVGRGQALQVAPAPWIAIPTTAGTGAEVTRNAVLGVPEQQVKVSLRSPLMLPRIALIDPELTYSLPPDLTASTGMDALTQCLEPFVSPAATPFTDGFCREGMRRAARGLRRAFQAGGDAAAREDMAIASVCGGLALANARLGAVHGFAGPLGGMFPAPHGVICGRLLGPVMHANIAALREQAADNPALERYSEAAQILSGDPAAQPEDGAAWVDDLCAEFGLPGLGSYGVNEQSIPDVVAKARRASSMQGNPITLSDDELTQTLRAAI